MKEARYKIIAAYVISRLKPHLVNSSPRSAAYKRQLIRSALVQIMAWRIFGTKPLSISALGHCELDP